MSSDGNGRNKHEDMEKKNSQIKVEWSNKELQHTNTSVRGATFLSNGDQP